MEKKGEEADILRRKRWISGISIFVVVAIVCLLTYVVCDWFSGFSKEEFRDYIQSYGPTGWLVLLGLQFLQVFIALIPGELLETAAGYAFGPLWGTLICYIGVALASSLIFWLTKRFGMKLVEVFVSREKINELRFINTEEKRNGLVFLLYFIPGTPKDLITYFVGLTDMRLSTFLIISMPARIPSVISSTFGGHLLGEGDYWGAIIIYGVIGIASLLGLYLYNNILRRRKSAEEKNNVSGGKD